MQMHQLAKLLRARGVSPDDHHATIRAAYREVRGMDASKDDLHAVRDAMREVPDIPDEEAYLERMKEEDPEKWEKVVRITRWGADGNPVLVLIECQDPQRNGQGDSVCDGMREVAVQELFQVYRCTSCQKRATQIYMNRRARERRAERKQKEQNAAS